MTPASAQEFFRLSLDGEWRFITDVERAGIQQQWFSPTHDRSLWQPLQVPKFWEEGPGLGSYDGWGWYARTFTLAEVTDSAAIHFGGVDDDARVWLNGIEIGYHTGYTDPFSFEISSALRAGENLLVVQVNDNAGGGGIYKPVTIIDARRVDELLKGEYYNTPARASADWVRDARIYCVYLRSFSPEGTFSALQSRIPELKELGVNVIWLLPIHPVGIRNRKGSLGSPYSVRDYYEVNPEFGTMLDFRKLVDAIHRNGMKIIIDLVANHTAWDSKLLKQHPQWFTKDARGNIISPNSDWTDVADLDYSRPGLRKYMMDMMEWWVKDINIDGFRCDVAEMVPTDFWKDARRRLDKIKPVMMLSEGSLPEHHAAAFDITYSWNVYDILEPLVKGTQRPAALNTILRQEALQYPLGSLRMRFNTNHDKNAWENPAVTKFGASSLPLTVVLVATIPGVPLIYNGEEVANDRKLGLFEKVAIDWSRPREIGDLYKSLFRLRREHPALTRGGMTSIPTSLDDKVYAFSRSQGKDLVLVALNFSAEEQLVTLEIPEEQFSAPGSPLLMNNAFHPDTLILTPGQPFQLNLKPHGYAVFVREKPPAKKR